MFGSLKERFKKNAVLNPASHWAYYKFIEARYGFFENEKTKQAIEKLRGSALYSKLCRMNGRAVTPQEASERKKVWAFNAGNTFSGNPKWLFIYINKYRKDIDAYWICDNARTVKYITGLGYRAYTFRSVPGIAMQMKTGVFCVEQVKESIPSNMPKDVILLNLYHGVGCKTVEKKVNFGFLAERIAKKYIQYNEYYMTHMLFLVTSPLMEEHFIKQIGMPEENLIRAGYPRCDYQRYYDRVATFDHDILKQKGLGPDTKIAAYVPTYRDAQGYDFWTAAVPDMERLVRRLEELDMLLIFKMHPQMLKDPGYQSVLKRYGQEKRLLFWDNQKDFYEIFDRIDLGIVDYSSIFYDMLSGGVKHFIRYFYDYDQKDENLRDFVFDLEEMTCGTICRDFDALLESLGETPESDMAEVQRIEDLFWKYSGKDSMETIIDAALSFTPKEKSGLPHLYTFDIFDTLIGRRVLAPEGIFYAVKHRMEQNPGRFPLQVTANYPDIRHWCEMNARDYYAKTLEKRGTDWREISFDMIFDRMEDVYDLSKDQTALLKEWELETELENVIPCPETLGKLEALVAAGEHVWLISDMYLDEKFIRRMLDKVSPVAAKLPMFVSSAWGVQKTTHLLYLRAYLENGDWNYSGWTHYGDSEMADGNRAIELGITPVLHTVPEASDYELAIQTQLKTYDAFLTTALMGRFRAEHEDDPKAVFAYTYVSLYLVPYVHFAVHDALKRGIHSLYFISRDGYHLMRIADAIIEAEHLPVKTKYIYGSRRAWRIPSFITDVDEEFFAEYGNFSGANSYDKVLKALLLTDEEFIRMFPRLSVYRGRKNLYREERDEIASIVKESREYRKYILDIAHSQLGIVNEYLRQEIDFSEDFAFVEYWGRGYTQTCFTRLLQYAAGGRELDDIYYYARSIYPSDGNDVRVNFTSNTKSMVFVEALFANMPYKSVESYKKSADGTVEPVFETADYDKDLFAAMEQYLPAFAASYALLPALDRDRLNRELYDFSLNYLADHMEEDPFIPEQIGSLVDAISMYGGKREYAPKVTPRMIVRSLSGWGIATLTTSRRMSVARSGPRLGNALVEFTQTVPQIQKMQVRQKAKRKQERDQFLDRVAAARRKQAEYGQNAAKLRSMYADACREKRVTGRILLVVSDPLRGRDLQRCLERAQRSLKMKADVQILSERRLEKPSKETMELLASCRAILTERPPALFSALKLRGQTLLILLPETAAAPEEAGKSYDERKMALQWLQIPFTAVCAAGSADLAAYRQKYPNAGRILDCGSPATDLYFSEEEKNRAGELLRKRFPLSAGKKILVYLSKDRKLPDLNEMREKLREDYFLVTASGGAGEETTGIPQACADFAGDAAKVLSGRQMLLCADALAGDDPLLTEGAELLKLPLPVTGKTEGTDTAALCFRLLHPEEPVRAESGETKTEPVRDHSFCRGESMQALLAFIREYKQ